MTKPVIRVVARAVEASCGEEHYWPKLTSHQLCRRVGAAHHAPSYTRPKRTADAPIQLNSLFFHAIQAICAATSPVLIDVHPLIFRSFYANPTMTRADGVPVNAVYGYTRAILKIMRDLPADFIGGSFRNKLVDDYKANRKQAPDDLKPQFNICKEATNALGIPLITVPGLEADDVIATYTGAAKQQGLKVTIVTSDKDLMQLCDDQVRVFDITKNAFVGATEVEAKFGVTPKQLPDYFALAGDAVDNVKGVPGFGAKTSAALIKEFGSIEKLMSNVNKVEPVAKRERIKAFAASIATDMELLKLRLTPDLPVPIDKLVVKPMDLKKLMSFLEAQNFNSIISQLTTSGIGGMIQSAGAKKRKKVVDPNAPPPPPPVVEIVPPSKRDVLRVELKGITAVQDMETAERVLAKLMTLTKNFHACDTETTDIDLSTESPVGHGKVICASIYSGPEVDFGNGPRIWIDNLGPCEGLLDVFKPFWESPAHLKVWHNVSFDRHVMYNHGIDVQGFGGDTMHMARLWNASRTIGEGYSLEALTNDLLQARKRTIKERFGSPHIRVDGTEGKAVVVPDLDELQRNTKYVADWVDYSTYDAEGTWKLREVLEAKLRAMPWQGVTTMWDFYQQLWMPFGYLLTDMERRGVKVDVAHLKRMEQQAIVDRDQAESKFKTWATSFCPDAAYMNVSSDAQKQQLLFAPATNIKTGDIMPDTRVFKTENTEKVIIEGKKKALKHKEFTIKGIGMPPLEYTASGWPAVGGDVLETLAGDPAKGKFGKAMAHYSDPDLGKEACTALRALSDAQSIDTLLSNFLQPLQTQVDKNLRIHGSFNLNTETGRLSSRRPNLQNQPALEKDRYKIRKAFTCEEGNKLIVADYGQLELRLLAHMTKCKSMIDAFKQGGDFHSRTAIGMYPHVTDAVKQGTCLLEWDSAKGKPTAPLLKDMFAMERRRAKVLNFSIAYGKTPVGLAKDWSVSLEEAQNTLNLWYRDRPEVLEWQKKTIEMAKRTGFTRTLMGRYRPLPQIKAPHIAHRKHAERAAINTPLQGGAADVVVKAMLHIHQNQRLQDLGWKMLLQIHDGPQESAAEALELTKSLMSNPFRQPLLVDLVVDARLSSNWLEGK